MEKKLTKTQEKFEELKKEVYSTVYGKMTINQMYERFGLPTAHRRMARVEVLTGSTNTPTKVVDRFVDGILVFAYDLRIVIQSAQMLKMFEANYGDDIYVRHPNYNSTKIPSATAKELKEA